jgi:hypothetical protein
MVSEPLSSLRMGERAQVHEGRQRALVRMPKMGRSHEGCQWGCWVPKDDDCDVPHRLDMGMSMCLYVYSHHS